MKCCPNLFGLNRIEEYTVNNLVAGLVSSFISSLLYNLSSFLSTPYTFRVPLTISFKALREGEYNYNVQCNVKRKPTPVTLNIKAEGYSISVDVECDTEDGSTVMLTENKTAIRKIDMGTVSHLNQFYCDVPFDFKINVLPRYCTSKASYTF